MVGEEHPCQYKLTSTVLKGNKTNEKGMNSFLCMCVYTHLSNAVQSLRCILCYHDDRKTSFMKILLGIA